MKGFVGALPERPPPKAVRGGCVSCALQALRCPNVDNYTLKTEFHAHCFGDGMDARIALSAAFETPKNRALRDTNAITAFISETIQSSYQQLAPIGCKTRGQRPCTLPKRGLRLHMLVA